MTFLLILFAVAAALMGAVAFATVKQGWRNFDKRTRVAGVSMTVILFISSGVSALAGIAL